MPNNGAAAPDDRLTEQQAAPSEGPRLIVGRPQKGGNRDGSNRSHRPTAAPASHVLGLKLDSIPFSAYHVVVIAVLGLVGFVQGYDLALTGSLLVLAKGPLHLAPDEVRALATWSTFLVVIGAETAFTAAPVCARQRAPRRMLAGEQRGELIE